MSVASGANKSNYEYKITKYKEIMSKIKTLTFGNEVNYANTKPLNFIDNNAQTWN